MTRKKLITLFVLAGLLSGLISQCNRPVKEISMYAPEERMEEWNDWKFGLFIHWGAWCQREIGYIWHITREESPEEREASFELYKTFNPVKFDPAIWARAAKDAGMKYVVFTTKHHDGFSNFETQHTDLKVTNPECPYSQQPEPDILKKLVKAFRDEGLAIGFYFSHIDWHHPDAKYFSTSHWEYDRDLIDEKPKVWERAMAFERGQVEELLSNYGQVDIFWFDIRWPYSMGNGEPYTHPRVKEDITDLVRFMREKDPSMIINNRGVDEYGDFFTPEQRIPASGYPGWWESNITISNTRGFWYKGEEVTYKSKKELIHMLVDIASKGGNFLLNVGPRPDGTFTDQEIDRLKQIGDWMKINGDSIYGTTRTVFRHLDWGRCTRKGSTLYLHVMDWPCNGVLHVPGLKNPVRKAFLLSDPDRSRLEIQREDDDLMVSVGASAPDPVATVVVLEIEGEPDVDNRIRQFTDGTIELRAAEAQLHGEGLVYEFGTGVREGDFIRGWNSLEQSVEWTFWVDNPGIFRVEMIYGCPRPDAGGGFRMTMAGGELTGTVQATTERDRLRQNRPELKTFKVGKLSVATAGEYTLTIETETLSGRSLMALRSVLLKPVN